MRILTSSSAYCSSTHLFVFWRVRVCSKATFCLVFPNVVIQFSFFRWWMMCRCLYFAISFVVLVFVAAWSWSCCLRPDYWWLLTFLYCRCELFLLSYPCSPVFFCFQVSMLLLLLPIGVCGFVSLRKRFSAWSTLTCLRFCRIFAGFRSGNIVTVYCFILCPFSLKTCAFCFRTYVR